MTLSPRKSRTNGQVLPHLGIFGTTPKSPHTSLQVIATSASAIQVPRLACGGVPQNLLMSLARLITGCFLAAALVSTALAADESPKSDDAVAKVNGRTITRAQLYDQGAATLLQQRYDFYHAERDTLGRVIDDELLAAEARRRGITPEQLVDQEINKKVQDPNEAELRVFYEGAQTDQSFESLRPQLLARVRQTRAKNAREVLLSTLRQQAKIQILLAPPFSEVAVSDSQARGPKNAPVSLVEFADFECPFCRQMQPAIEKLLKDYNGRVALYFKDFPLSIHPHAEKASEAARCAGQQGAFWPYHDLLFREDAALEVSNLKQYARMLRLDAAKFDACLDSGAQGPAIQNDVTQGQHLGIAGTPGFFINGHFLSGVVSYETLREVVDQQVSSPTAPVR